MAQGRLGVLDGLRGIAILWVLWYHIWQISWLPAPLHALQFIPETGFEGVDLFFWISGFVIAYPFIKALVNGEPQPAWGHFAYRRLMKIVPSYVLSIAVAIAIGYAHFTGGAQALRDVGAHLFFVHTFSYDTYGSINGVLWTLAVEVQFYALFPLLWLAFKHYPWLTAAIMTALSIAYRMHALQCCANDWMELLVFNLPGYLDVFAAGMISALLYARWRDRAARAQAPLATIVSLAGFACLILLMRSLWSARSAPEWMTVWQIDHRTLVAGAFVLAAVGSLLALPAWQRVVANPALLFFAAISYNLYLYHQMLARELARLHLGLVAFTIAAVAGSIALATIVTYGFERPLLRVPMARLSRRRALIEV